MTMPKGATTSNNRKHIAQPYQTSRYTNTATPNTGANMMLASRPTMAPALPNLPHERASVAWSTEDDQHLMEYRAKGYNWNQISQHFNNKTANACRKRHERLMEKKNSENYDSLKNEDLANAYMECREQMWRMLADKLGESKWQTIESKCMEKGLKNLATAHRSRKNSRATDQHHSSPASHHSGGYDNNDSSLDMSEQGVSAPHQMLSYGHNQYGQTQPSYYPNNSNVYASTYMPPPSLAPSLPPLTHSSHSATHLPPMSNYFHRPQSSGQMVSASYA